MKYIRIQDGPTRIYLICGNKTQKNDLHLKFCKISKIFKCSLCTGRRTGRLPTASHDIWICAGVPASVASNSRPNYQLRFPLCLSSSSHWFPWLDCLPAIRQCTVRCRQYSGRGVTRVQQTLGNVRYVGNSGYPVLTTNQPCISQRTHYIVCCQ